LPSQEKGWETDLNSGKGSGLSSGTATGWGSGTAKGWPRDSSSERAKGFLKGSGSGILTHLRWGRVTMIKKAKEMDFCWEIYWVRHSAQYNKH